MKLLHLSNDLLLHIYTLVPNKYTLRCTCKRVKSITSVPVSDIIDYLDSIYLFDWICKNSYITSASTTGYIAEFGTINLLKHAVDELHLPVNAWTVNFAAKKGNLDMIKYLHEIRCYWDDWAPMYAASKGHLHVLKYLHLNGCEWNVWTPGYAACNGHLECLQYAHVNYCDWDSYTLIAAIKNGHDKCLEYALTNNCPYDEYVLEYAEKYNKLHYFI